MPAALCIMRRRLYLFDCIEFNARFRCADVAAEVAFLSMDLDHLGRADLSVEFVNAYVRRSPDRQLLSLLDFYKCYRAFVRGKVLGFRLHQANLPPVEAEDIKRHAQAYFELAYTYASRPVQPILLIVMGLPASGKSTLARAVASRCGLIPLSSDVVRKHLAGVRPTDHRMEPFGRSLYGRSMTRRKASRYLRNGQSVVLDSTFGQPAERATLRHLARRAGAQLVVVVCRADESVIKARLAARTSDANTTSDARLELWPALKAAFVEPIDIPDALNVDTTRPLATTVELVMSALRSFTPLSASEAA
jgi:predicted kinase